MCLICHGQSRRGMHMGTVRLMVLRHLGVQGSAESRPGETTGLQILIHGLYYGQNTHYKSHCLGEHGIKGQWPALALRFLTPAAMVGLASTLNQMSLNQMSSSAAMTHGFT